MKKIKQFVNDHPDSVLLTGALLAASTVLGVAIYVDVKEQKEQKNWIKSEEAKGNTVLFDDLGRLVSATSVSSVYR